MKQSDLASQLAMMTNAVQSGQGSGRPQRDICKTCGRRILAGTSLTTTAGDSFHKEHFQCNKCHKTLSTEKHYYSAGEYFCPECWTSRCDVCAKCGEPILQGAKVNALGKVWHEDHFRCAECDCLLQGSFGVRDGRPYCAAHAKAASGLMCARCNKPITQGLYFNNKDGTRHWHEGCFTCASCRMPFTDRSHYELNGDVYCQLHYHTMKGSVCAGCGLPVIGDALEANNAVWFVSIRQLQQCFDDLISLFIISFFIVQARRLPQVCSMWSYAERPQIQLG